MENLLLLIPIAFAIAFLIFRKRLKKQKAIFKNVKNIENQQQSEKSETDSPETLIKQATEIKSKDVHRAIVLIEKAISLEPIINFDHHFKLASYYHYSGRIQDAYFIYDKLLTTLKIEEGEKYNACKSQILEKICTVNYKNGEYENYLFNYSFWLYNSLLSFACQGKYKETKSIINNKNKLSYLAPSKVEGCFKKLKIEEAKKYFNEQLNIYFNNIQDEIIFLCNKAKGLQKENNVLSNDKEFMKIYLKLNDDESFGQFYNTNIKNYNIKLTNNQTAPSDLPSELPQSLE